MMISCIIFQRAHGSIFPPPPKQVGRRKDAAPEGWPDPAPEHIEGFVTATFDLDEVALTRAAWGIFRDRRPDLYTAISTLDGVTK